MSKLKLLSLIITSAIGGIILFLAAIYGYNYIQYKNSIEDKTISTPPPIEKNKPQKKYLGILGVTSGQFDWKNAKKLTPGKGEILGHILKDGAPCEGVELKILLNGNTSTEYGKSNAEGQYLIKVPYGEYRIDGWQLKFDSVDEILDGKILEPLSSYNFQNIVISTNNPANGPSLNFIDPIKIIQPKGIINYSENIKIQWSKVKSAKKYRIQIVDRGANLHGSDYIPLFETNNDRPITITNEVSLKDIGVELSKGHYYTVMVEALNDINERITESPHKRENGFFIKK